MPGKGTGEQFKIEIDMESEYQAYKRDEPDVSTQDAVLGHVDEVDEGESSVRIAKWMLVARQLKESAEGILRPLKTELIAGATSDVESFIKRQKDTYQFGEHYFKVPRYKAKGIGRPPSPPDPDELETDDEWEEPTGYVRTDSNPEAADFAERHLDTFVMGNLRNHLLIVRVAKGKEAMVAKAEAWFAEARKVVSELAENGD